MPVRVVSALVLRIDSRCLVDVLGLRDRSDMLWTLFNNWNLRRFLGLALR